jgi:uncharacterized membrane protein
MLGAVSAMLAAAVYGSSVILATKNLDKSTVLNATFAMTLAGNIVLWPLVLLFTDLSSIRFEGMLAFAVAGALAPGVGRLFYYRGVRALGSSTNASIFASYPMCSATMATLILNETLSTTNWVGIVFTLLGATIVEGSRHRDKTRHGNSLRDLALPAAAAFSVAVSQVVRKYGLSVYGAPLIGVATGYACSLLIYVLISFRSSSSRRVRCSPLYRDLQLFWKAGISSAIGWLLTFFALNFEKVSIVTPILQTEALFIIFFSRLFLGKSESISSEMAVGTLVVVFGVVLVSIQ